MNNYNDNEYMTDEDYSIIKSSRFKVSSVFALGVGLIAGHMVFNGEELITPLKTAGIVFVIAFIAAFLLTGISLVIHFAFVYLSSAALSFSIPIILGSYFSEIHFPKIGFWIVAFIIYFFYYPMTQGVLITHTPKYVKEEALKKKAEREEAIRKRRGPAETKYYEELEKLEKEKAKKEASDEAVH